MENYALDNAFDNNYSTYYLSQVSNGESYLGVDNVVNTIEVEFDSIVNIDKFVFKNCGYLAAGYPSILNFYYSDGEGEYQLLDAFDSIAKKFGVTTKDEEKKPEKPAQNIIDRRILQRQEEVEKQQEGQQVEEEPKLPPQPFDLFVDELIVSAEGMLQDIEYVRKESKRENIFILYIFV